ncbi:MAG: TetR/AcrR family transcriptional regulator [Lachnospiraceae bacterium]|nr:TetR/AcrR family transcriptional regulator [Lachnospiraceae bacterium]
MDNEKIKDSIIKVTTELIEQYEGNTKMITSRLIAEKANIGLGSINYYFGSKENLITECVQKIINKVLFAFSPEIKECNNSDGLSDKERLTNWASQTFDFLFDNQAITNISIMGDMQNYLADNNSVYIQKGYLCALRDNNNENIKKLLIFILVSTMQVAFLAKNTTKELLGYDLYLKNQRDLFIKNIVNILFDGMYNTEEFGDEA